VVGFFKNGEQWFFHQEKTLEKMDWNPHLKNILLIEVRLKAHLIRILLICPFQHPTYE